MIRITHEIKMEGEPGNLKKSALILPEKS